MSTPRVSERLINLRIAQLKNLDHVPSHYSNEFLKFYSSSIKIGYIYGFPTTKIPQLDRWTLYVGFSMCSHSAFMCSWKHSIPNHCETIFLISHLSSQYGNVPIGTLAHNRLPYGGGTLCHFWGLVRGVVVESGRWSFPPTGNLIIAFNLLKHYWRLNKAWIILDLKNGDNRVVNFRRRS